MTTKILIALCLLFGVAAKAQRPIFANPGDSIAYVILDGKLTDRFQQSIGNARVVDSIMLARKVFMDTHPFVWRYSFRQDPSYTPYQSLKSIANKDSITRISVYGKGRRKLPDSLYAYANLAELELIEFRLSRLPKKLLKSRQLKKLIVYNNLPEKRLKLPKNSSITTLIIRGDEKGKLPKSYKPFRNLQVLTLSRNNIREFKEIKLPESIRRIDLSVNNITIIPSWIGLHKNLKSLNFNNNKVERVEPGIEKITGLQELSLYKNNLSEIPPMLYTMRLLKVIDLYYNHIPKVSREIGNWKDLEILYLANNEIYSIPDEIGELTKLKELYLHHNKISNLPLSIGNLKDLGILRINNNNLIEWPAGLNSLKQLGNFDCSSNQFENIPITELDFRNMKILSLGGNPWNADAKKNIDVWVEALRENEVVVHIDDARR